MALHNTGLTAAGLMWCPTSATQSLDILLADLAILQFHLPGPCLISTVSVGTGRTHKRNLKDCKSVLVLPDDAHYLRMAAIDAEQPASEV